MALAGERPQGRITRWISATDSRVIASGVAARANRSGVIWFTLTSVHCADSEHCDQQGIGIPMLEGDLDLGVDVVEDPADPTGFVRALHDGPSITGREAQGTR